MTDPWKEFLREELNKEADKIEAEVLKDDSLKDVKTTPEMYESLMEKIREADAAKGVNTEADRYSALTEEEKEFLRIGREIKAQGANIVYKRKKKRMAFLFVAVMVIMVAGMGVTSVGGPQYLAKIFTQKIGNREMTQTDTNADGAKSGESNEEMAYQGIKDTLAFDPVRFDYLPNDTTFKKCDLNKDIQKVDLVYKVGEKMLHYKMKTNYTEGGFSLDVEDQLTNKETLNVSGVEIIIKTYEIADSSEKLYSAQYEYNNVQYFLFGSINKNDFEEIVKNLHFF